MANLPTWSYSSLTAFETCPRQYHIMRVLKLFKEPPSEQMKWGIEVHKAFEDGVKFNKPLPKKMDEWQPILLKFQKAKGTKHTELQLAINANFEQVGWWDKTAWCRAALDIVVENQSSALAGDWKTGKRKPGSTQLMMASALLMHTKPHIEKVTTSYIWLQEKKLDNEVFKRENLSLTWKEFMPRVQKMEIAFQKDKWLPQPSGLCGWCHVGKERCEFWKPGKGNS